MGTSNVYEQAKLTIRVKLKETSKKTSDRADLILIVNGSRKAPINLAVNMSWVAHPHTFENVPDDKDNYELTYEVRHDTETIRGGTVYTVWPLTTKIKLINDADGADLPDTAFDLKFTDETVSHFVTGTDATCECKLKEKSAFTIPELPRLAFARWEAGKDHGRDRVARVLPVKWKAKITAPTLTPPETSIVQYVNVASAKTGAELGQDHLGAKVAIAVQLVHAIDPSRAGAPAGAPIYCKVTVTNKTKRTLKLATLEGATDLDTTTADVIKGKFKSGVGGKATVLVQLGLGGLEKYKVEIGTTAACADAKLEFQGQRKIWLQTIGVAASIPAVTDAAGAMKKVGIIMERDPDVAIDTGTAPAGSMVPGKDFGLPKAQLVVGNHNVSQFTSKWTKAHAPLSAYAVFCDYQFDGNDYLGNKLKRETSYTFDDSDTCVWPPTGATVKGFPVTPVSSVADATILAINVHDGTPAVKGTWVSKATAPSPHQGASGDIPADHLHVEWAREEGTVWVKLPPASLPVVADGEEVSVRLTVYYVDGCYNGWAPSNPPGGVVIAVRNGAGSSGARSATGMNQTLVHEIGHLLNQVDDPATAGTGLDRATDHKLHYTGRGHSGGHCAFGIPNGVFTAGGDLTGQAAATCVMYGEGSDTRGIDYCVKCAPFLLGEPMESLV